MSAAAPITSALPPIPGHSAAASAAVQSMAELGCAGLIGAGCVERQVLTPHIIKALSSVTFSILLPMFLGTSIVKSVTKYGLNKSSLAVPMLAALQSFVLYLVTTLLTLPLVGIDGKSDDGRGTTVCCSFGNSGVVPLIFCESLFRPPYQRTPDAVAKSTAFVSLFLVGWSPFFWAFGRSVLLGDDGAVNSTTASKDDGNDKISEFLKTVKRGFPPPVVGVMVGLLVATTPLCRLFVTVTSISAADKNVKAPLAVVFNTFANFGRAASPLSLLVLVSSLAIGAGMPMNKDRVHEPFHSKGSILQQSNHNNQVEKGDFIDTEVSFLTRWILVSVTRFLLSPLLMYGLLTLAARFDVIGSPEDNPMLWFVLLLEASMPPAQNSVIMYQVADKAKKAGEMAKFLFSVYATSMVPVVLVLTWALGKFGLA